jgi:hypothetical protein
MFSAKHFGIENWQKFFFQKQIIENYQILKMQHLKVKIKIYSTT